MPLQTETVLEAQNKFDLPFEHETFVRFLVEAKKNTYASSTGDYKTKSLISGGHQLEYASGEFLYRDIYMGEGFFAGQEIVYFKGKPVWSMTYAGQIYNSASSEEINVVARHLFASLARIEHIAPYRGPSRFDRNDCCYVNEYRGITSAFSGEELITLKGKQLFELRYSGGFLR